MTHSSIAHSRPSELVRALDAGPTYSTPYWGLSHPPEISIQWGRRTVALIQFVGALGMLVIWIEKITRHVFTHYIPTSVIPPKDDISLYQNLTQLDEIPPLFHQDPILSKFICPISLCPIRHPVRDPHSKTIYERASILKWIEEHSTSPMTRLPLTKEQLIPSLAISCLINYRLDILEKLVRASLAPTEA